MNLTQTGPIVSFVPSPQAKLVAAATQTLCEAANGVVQGDAEEEKLITAAKAVAASTAQLLIACQVRGERERVGRAGRKGRGGGR